MDFDGPEDTESNYVGNSRTSYSYRSRFTNDGTEFSQTSSNKISHSDETSESVNKIDLSSLLERVKDVSYKYHYLDHPADVILLGEGKTIKEALQSISVALFNYMSDLSYVEVSHFREVEISGRGLLNLLYHLLDECLYLYSSEYFIAKHVLIEEELVLPKTLCVDEFNSHIFSIKALALGDHYDKVIHKSGTEIKAITMHYLNFNLWFGDQCYEYKNDMESHDKTLELLSVLDKNNNFITMCKVYCLVDI